MLNGTIIISILIKKLKNTHGIKKVHLTSNKKCVSILILPNY